jgi:lipoprotein-anchoring transpeptidase ErfK/SrfK
MVKSFSCRLISIAILTCVGITPDAIANPSSLTVQTPELPAIGAVADQAADQPGAIDVKAVDENNAVRLVLRLQERQLYVYRGEEAIATYPVAIGRPDTPTPTGEFQIFEMLEDPAWKNPRTGEIEPPGANGSLGTRWMGFATMPNGVIGFHGTPNRASIGSAASHGCVRMRNEDAEALFRQIELGTIVIVES